MAAPSQQIQVSIQQLMAMALESHSAGRLSEATELYELILAAQPNLPEVCSNLAAAYQAQGRLAAAVESYRSALQLQPGSAVLHGNLGTVLYEMGQAANAIECYRQAQALGGDDADTLCNLAAAHESLGELDEAVKYCQAALSLDCHHARSHNNLGTSLRKRGKLQAAVLSFRQALRLRPAYTLARGNLAAAEAELELQIQESRLREGLRGHADEAGVHSDLGNVLKAQGKIADAEAAYRNAIRVDPKLTSAYCNLGALLAEREDFNAAVACYQSALAYDPGNLQVHNNLGAVCLQMDEVERAAACFEIAISKQPAPPEFHANMGSALLGLERQEEALVHFHRAVELAPKRADFQRSLGNTLLFLNRHQDAIECYRRSLELEPNAAETWGNLGSALTEVNQREEAVVSYRRALRISPDKHELGSVLAHHLQHLCEWEEWEALECRVLSEKSLASHEINPFTLLSLSSTARQQLIATRAGVDKSMRSGSKVYQSWPHKNALPRIGYLSADFRDHPVAHLLGEVFELHDRSRVEVFAYSSLGKDDRSAARQRIQTSAHHFVDVEPLSVKATAQRIHEDGIDVLIDLGGYTQNNRAGVFALRPAPVQVNYLGYPGTLGAAYIDYIITDRFVTPPEAQAHFSEKFVYMPHCFQPNDRRKAIAANTPGRKACGLPGQGFVFCSFNRSYKFTPQIFDVWMRLLKAVSGSVLWLSDGSQTMMDNLRREASRRGVEPQRVIFAPRVDVMAEHLARQRHADLFLDTLPYNAHTSASDALWAGLPVLTCAGETFASRVAGSLLHAVGLPELVTSSLTDYEALALKLAGDRALLASCRQRLLANRLTTPLFDSAGFVKDLERAYELMWQNYREGNPPRRLEV